MKLKQMGIALIAAGMLSANAYASEVAIEQALAPQAAFSETDLNLLFEQEAGKPLQLAALSEQEMRETEGARGLPGAIGGAIIGGIGNAGYQLGARRGWSWGSFGYAVGAGALTGFTGGAAAWYVVPRVAFFGGFAAGRMGW